jgi:hypothetical protein
MAFVATVRGSTGLLPLTVSIQETNGESEFVIAIASDPPYCDPRVMSIEDARRLHEWLGSKLGG